MSAEWETVDGRARGALTPAGLDLVVPFRVGWFDAVAAPGHRLGSGPDDGRLGLVVGSTKALWPRFLAWLADDRGRIELDDPLDAYVEGTIAATVAVIGRPAVAHFAHRGPPWLAIQRIAEVAGLARRSPTHLAIHPVFGPWIALRAAIVVELAGPPGDPPRPPDPCTGCTAPCRERLAVAEAATGERGGRAAWREWLAVRDACPVGRAHRYPDDALRYHALSDKELLRRLV